MRQKKTFSLAWGKEMLEVELPGEARLLGVLDLAPEERVSEEEVIREALAHPLGTPPLREMVRPGETVCVVVSDITRAWQRMGVYLPFIVEELRAGGVEDGDITFLCATGTHRAQTPEEEALILGPELTGRFSLVNHDCHSAKDMVALGTTSFGTPVRINRAALECDRLVVTGVVAYHVMAGWGGGRKSVLPGIAAYESIQTNHALALDPHPGGGRNPRARCGNLEDNPVHLDMAEGCALAKPDFLFNVIMGTRGIVSAVAGHWEEAWLEGTRRLDVRDGIPFEEPADLVITSAGGYPKDGLFSQACKAIFNASEAVKDGGVLVVLARCDEGGGSEEFLSMLTEYATGAEREAALREHFSIARYVGYLLGEYAARCSLFLVAGLDPGVLAGSGIEVFSSPEEALEAAREKLSSEMTAWVIPHGGALFPKAASVEG